MFKVIGISLLIFGAIISITSWDDISPFWLNKPNQKLEVIWRQDIASLIRSGKLPKEWREISEVKVEALNEEAKSLLSEIKVPIVTRPEGTHRVEIYVDSWSEATNKTIVIQYHLFDKASQNLVWELGRTLSVEN
jgi:hypothetical protein